MRLGKFALLAFAGLILGSCSYRFPLDLIIQDGRLIFTTEREWKWFVVPRRPRAELCSLDVFDSEQYVWRIRGKGGQCLKDGIPIAYGEQRPQLETIVRARPLIAGRRYGVNVSSWEIASENFSMTGGLKPSVRFHRYEEGNWIYDPEDVAFQRRRTRRINELKAKGLSEEDATARWAEEAFPATQEAQIAPAAPARPDTSATTK